MSWLGLGTPRVVQAYLQRDHGRLVAHLAMDDDMALDGEHPALLLHARLLGAV